MVARGYAQARKAARATGPRGPLRPIVVRAAELDADFERFVDLVRRYGPLDQRDG